jgi:hypothetical protein
MWEVLIVYCLLEATLIFKSPHMHNTVGQGIFYWRYLFTHNLRLECSLGSCCFSMLHTCIWIFKFSMALFWKGVYTKYLNCLKQIPCDHTSKVVLCPTFNLVLYVEAYFANLCSPWEFPPSWHGISLWHIWRMVRSNFCIERIGYVGRKCWMSMWIVRLKHNMPHGNQQVECSLTMFALDWTHVCGCCLVHFRCSPTSTD